MSKITKIAVISAGWKDEYQETIMEGIEKACANLGFTMASFLTFNVDTTNMKRNAGSYNIYNLVNEKSFDGVIVIPNNLLIPEVRDAMVKQFSTFTIPVVMLDYDAPNCYCVTTDNYGSMKQLLNHMFEKHDYKRIAFITGPEYNYDSNERFRAYKDALKAHNLPYDERYIHHGVFQRKCGENAVDRFMGGDFPKPDLIVCANDVMATGAHNRLTALGYKVPSDVALTGYDNSVNASLIDPPLTTVDRSLLTCGDEAVRIINDCINGKKTKKTHTIPGVSIIRGSCGCNTNEANNHNEVYRNFYMTNADNNYQFAYMTNLMLDRFSENEDIDDLFENLKYFIERLNTDEFYICFTEQQTSLFTDMKESKKKLTFGYMLNGYSEKMYLPLCYCKGKFFTDKPFQTEDVLPYMRDSKERKEYIFVPLHFRGKPIGYCAIGNYIYQVRNHNFLTWIAGLVYAIESQSNFKQLKTFSEKLDSMYVSDYLTGLNNRYGFNRFSEPLLQDAIKNHSTIAVFFADIDHMKMINDCYGHEAGDLALTTVADILKDLCKDKTVAARFGGDEFIIFSAGYCKDDAEEFLRKFNERLERINVKRSFNLSVSCGYYLAQPDEKFNMEKCISKADKQMYLIKEEQRRKEGGLETQ